MSTEIRCAGRRRGATGLSIAARLTQLQVDTLIVAREQRIGDNCGIDITP